MAIHSSILAWEIPWTEEPDGLQSMGLQRVGDDLATKHTHTTSPWNEPLQTPYVIFPELSQFPASKNFMQKEPWYPLSVEVRRLLVPIHKVTQSTAGICIAPCSFVFFFSIHLLTCYALSYKKSEVAMVWSQQWANGPEMGALDWVSDGRNITYHGIQYSEIGAEHLLICFGNRKKKQNNLTLQDLVK